MNDNRLTQAYRRLLDGLRRLIDQTGDKTGPVVERALEQVQEGMATAGEYTREELERVGDYLKRDVEDAARYMEETGHELGDWLRLDILLLEQQLLESFMRVADRTRIELTDWALRSEVQSWHSGEVAGPGALQCVDCGELLHFTEPGHIPPCPRCHGSRFRRIVD